MTWNIHDLKPKRESRAKPLQHAAKVAQTRAPHHADGPRSVFDEDDLLDEDDHAVRLTLAETRELHMAGMMTPREWDVIGHMMRRGVTEL